MLRITQPHADCNYGTQLDKKDTEVSSQVISRMQFVQSLCLTSHVPSLVT